MADKILHIMQFASKCAPPRRHINTVLQKNHENVNMENLKHELLKQALQVGDLPPLHYAAPSCMTIAMLQKSIQGLRFPVEA